MARRPLRDRVVESVLVRRPAHRVCEAGIVDEVGASHRRRQTPEGTDTGGGDVDEMVVSGRIEVVRGALGKPGAAPPGEVAELVVGRNPWLHEAEGAFVER